MKKIVIFMICSIWTISAFAQNKSNIIIVNPTISNSKIPAEGSKLYVTITVSNIGDVATNSGQEFYVETFISKSATFSRDNKSEQFVIPDLNSCEDYSISEWIHLPDNMSSGTWYIHFEVQDNYVTNESNYNDNTTYVSFQLGVQQECLGASSSTERCTQNAAPSISNMSITQNQTQLNIKFDINEQDNDAINTLAAFLGKSTGTIPNLNPEISYDIKANQFSNNNITITNNQKTINFTINYIDIEDYNSIFNADGVISWKILCEDINGNKACVGQDGCFNYNSFTFTKPPVKKITGYVYSYDTIGLSGATVYAKNEDGTTESMYTTIANGLYILEVPPSWCGSVSVSAVGNTFNPKSYSNVLNDITQNFTSTSTITPSVAICSPLVGNYTTDNTIDIQWVSSGNIPNVTLQLVPDDKSPNIVIASKISNTGFYQWNNPRDITGKLKIYCEDNSSINNNAQLSEQSTSIVIKSNAVPDNIISPLYGPFAQNQYYGKIPSQGSQWSFNQRGGEGHDDWGTGCSYEKDDAGNDLKDEEGNNIYKYCTVTDDRYAWDINYGPNRNSDNGLEVYAPYDCYLTKTGSWNGTNGGQILLRVVNPNNNKDWYLGYLHMAYESIKLTKDKPNNQFISAGTVIGRVAGRGYKNKAYVDNAFNPHLHYAAYYKDNTGKLNSVNRTIVSNSYKLTDKPEQLSSGSTNNSSPINSDCSQPLKWSEAKYSHYYGIWLVEVSTNTVLINPDYTKNNKIQSNEYQIPAEIIKRMKFGEIYKWKVQAFDIFNNATTSTNLFYFEYKSGNSPNGTSNLTGTISGSVLSNAIISTKNADTWIKQGVSDIIGNFNFTLSPLLKLNDSIKIEATGYEALVLPVDSFIINSSNLKIPMLPSNITTSNIIRPKIEIINNQSIFTTPTINLKISGDNLIKYQLFEADTLKVENSADIQDVNYTMNKLGENIFTVSFISSIDTVDISFSVIYSPDALQNSEVYSININPSETSRDGEIYLDGIFISKLTESSRALYLQNGSHHLKFKKIGYEDKNIFVDGNININLELNPLSTIWQDSVVMDFQKHNTFYWQGITVRNNNNDDINVKRYNQGYEELSIIPVSETISIKKDNAQTNYDFSIIFNNPTNITWVLHYLIIKTDDTFKKVFNDNNEIELDTLSQKLCVFSMYGINDIFFAKRQAPVINQNLNYNINAGSEISIPLTEIAIDPDAITNDMTFSIISTNNQNLVLELGEIDLKVKLNGNENQSGLINLSVAHDGIEKFATININNATSIKYIENIEKFVKIYPNPTKGLLKISFLKGTEINHLYIYDIHGKLYYETSNFNSDIELQLNQNGVYFIQITTDKEQSVRKIIKY